MINAKHAITERLESLQSWRHAIGAEVSRVRTALASAKLLSPDTEILLTNIDALVSSECVNIAFVADYTRGKSELINALFFTNLGERFLPSGEGRTTRCVTEIGFRREVKTSLKLMPIETRESARRFSELVADETQWRTVLFDADNPESVARALAALSETKRISLADAVAWGLHGEGLSALNNTGVMRTISKATTRAETEAAFVDVPRWRYAVINFPHPLLDAGLRIIDTPGLAAFSSEPELVRERLQDADALLLVLDIKNGVEKSDLTIWKDHLGGGKNRANLDRDLTAMKPAEPDDQVRLVVLNKIDTLATAPVDNEANANREWLRDMDRRSRETADLLGVDPISIVTVSAQLALAGAFENDRDKTLKSRLYQLERAITSALPVKRQDDKSRDILTALSLTLEGAQEELDQARYQALTGLSNLATVREKNTKLMTAIETQTLAKNTRLEATFKELRNIKSIHGKLGEELAEIVSLAAAKSDLQTAKEGIASAVMSGTVMDSCNKYLSITGSKLTAIEIKVAEIRTLFSNIGSRMRKEFGYGGLEAFDAHPFATHRFQAELDRAKLAAVNEFGKTSNLLTRRGQALAEQFEELVADRVLNIFKIAQRESATWMRGLFNTLEKPLGELKDQMDERSVSYDKVKSAELDLAERIAEIQGEIDIIKRKHETLADARAGLERYQVKQGNA